MKEAACLCRPLYPLCHREVPCNLLQDLLRKAEQFHVLHMEVLSVRLYSSRSTCSFFSVKTLAGCACMQTLQITSHIRRSLERHCMRRDRNSRGKHAHHHRSSPH